MDYLSCCSKETVIVVVAVPTNRLLLLLLLLLGQIQPLKPTDQLRSGLHLGHGQQRLTVDGV